MWYITVLGKALEFKIRYLLPALGRTQRYCGLPLLDDMNNIASALVSPALWKPQLQVYSSRLTTLDGQVATLPLWRSYTFL